MSRPMRRYQVLRRLMLPAILAGAAGVTCTDTIAPDLVVPIQIVASPDRDTLTLADSLILVVRSDSLEPLEVHWVVEPRSDTVRGDTLRYRPSVAGTEYVRAYASFEGERVGSTLRRFVTLPNAAPIVAIKALGTSVGRIPLGDTITLVAVVTDPDGDSIVPSARRWYLEDSDAAISWVPLGVGDTLRLPVTTVANFQLRLVVTDPAGATATTPFGIASYDPVTPAAWRTRLADHGASAVARHPSGLVLAAVAYSSIDPVFPPGTRMVMALTDDGRWMWTIDSRLDQAPLAVGDDGGIYQAGGQDGWVPRPATKLLKIGPDGSERWTLPDAGAILAPVMLWDGGVAIPELQGVAVVTSDGTERWSTTVDSVTQLRGLSVGADSTLYVLASTPAPTAQASVSAYSPDGALRWRVRVGTGAVIANAVIPADDSTLIVAVDSLFALRANGSVRWTRPGRFWHPAVGDARLHYVLADQLVALAVSDGAETWRVTLPPGAADPPILAANGLVVAAAGTSLLGFDVASGELRWRHELAGPISAPLLLTAGGNLIAADAFGFIEAIPIGAGPAAGPWPMAWADERRTGRTQRP